HDGGRHHARPGDRGGPSAPDRDARREGAVMLAPSDVVRVGASGLRTRPLRVVLSARGIAIGIAAMMAVVGISASSREDLRRQLDALGTNLLTVGPGQSFFGDASHLPDTAVSMVGRIGPVMSVTATGRVTSARVYRNDMIPTGQ